MKTDSATGAWAKQSSLGQADRASLGRESCSPGAVNPEFTGWGLTFVSLLLVLSHCFMRLGNFLSTWVN